MCLPLTHPAGECALCVCAQWIMLIDMSGYNRRSATPFHVTRSLIDVLRHHYPERSRAHRIRARRRGGGSRGIALNVMRQQMLTDCLMHCVGALIQLMSSLHCAVIIEAPWLLRTLVQPLMLVVVS